jgi:hypothetical protein
MRLISWTLRSGSEQFIYNWIAGMKTTRTWIKETGGSIKEQGIAESRVKATRKLSACTNAQEVLLRQHANCRLVPTPRKSC